MELQVVCMPAFFDAGTAFGLPGCRLCRLCCALAVCVALPRVAGLHGQLTVLATRASSADSVALYGPL